MRYHGLTWDHPRGYNALAAAQADGGPVDWSVQPLEGFESAPIAELCANYDLVVLDHPHLGEALATGCLTPLEDVFPAGALARIAGGAIGPAYSSYAMDGHQWALPLDAATQVMALRPDLTDHRPTTWADVIAASADGTVALSLAGPHAALSFLSVCASIDATLDMRDSGWPDEATSIEATEILIALHASSPAQVRDLNPIGLLEHMSRNDDVALIPLIYGYVNYAAPDRAHPILFRNAPSGVRPGSILGGTGIAISAKAQVSDTLREHLLWLMSPEVQAGFIPDHDGQPGLRSAWADPMVNAAWGDFYTNTDATLEAATIRPRHDGYIAFQSRASVALRDALAGGLSARTIARMLIDMHGQSLPNHKALT
ncbi:extracellular solute-binding protein [Chachezhania antarctica]|uniref:extracellular solute-binding protein n=1 Tax=Chachezhania antarctica TaxID=2340860 RepID=UPI000EB07DA7|nr:extracellular solute-binding protein [Chachezhania antarctica]|tara:strand:- start:2187 stop:3299 length:1113 start_codon:yes stop_codon:yes gene_type:complete